MKLQRQESRKVDDKKYDKWVVTIPPQTVRKMGWKEGDELAIQKMKNSILIYSASIKKGDVNSTYKMTVPKTKKYTLREEFIKVYNNLPLNERHEVIVVLDGEGITWHNARKYINHDTVVGKDILKKLKSLKIL